MVGWGEGRGGWWGGGEAGRGEMVELPVTWYVDSEVYTSVFTHHVSSVLIKRGLMGPLVFWC